MNRRTIVIILVIAAAVTFARIAWLNSLPDTGYFEKYPYYANRILAGEIPRDRLGDLSPAYLLFMIGARAVTTTRWAIRDVQLVMLTLAALLIGAAAWRLRGALAGVAAASIVLLNRAALVNASDFEPETLLLLFTAAALLFLVSERPLLAGLFFGLGITARPVVLLPAGCIVLLYLWRRRHRDAFRIASGTAIPIAILVVAHLFVTGEATIMDPGMAFFEGMNPYATGYEGGAPALVKRIEPTIGGPDTMHEAYRILASRAVGGTLSRRESNRYWTAKALAFARMHPGRAALLTWRKFTFALQGYDAWDVPSMTAIDHELQRVPLWISFALIIPLAIAGFVLDRRDDLALFALASGLPMVMFAVIGRHRQPILAASAIGCGLAIAAIVKRRHYTVAAVILVIAAVLSIDGPQQRQNAWIASAIIRAHTALQQNDPATAATWMPDGAPGVPPAPLHAAALRALATDSNPSRQYAAAICLRASGDRNAATQVFEHLAAEKYDLPWEDHAVSSVAYYLGRFQEARREAPGDPDVLAACEAAGDPTATAELNALWDPTTIAFARREGARPPSR